MLSVFEQLKRLQEQDQVPTETQVRNQIKKIMNSNHAIVAKQAELELMYNRMNDKSQVIFRKVLDEEIKKRGVKLYEGLKK